MPNTDSTPKSLASNRSIPVPGTPEFEAKYQEWLQQSDRELELFRQSSELTQPIFKPDHSLFNHIDVQSQKLDGLATRFEIQKILYIGLDPADELVLLAEVQAKSKLSPYDFRELVKRVRSEIEELDLGQSALPETDRILSATQSRLDIASILPSALALPIITIAQTLNLRPEVYLTALLTGISSLHKSGTKVKLYELTNFEVTPNLFGAIVAPPSQYKSPVIKAMISQPLEAIKRKAREEFQGAMAQYEADSQRYDSLKGEDRAEQFPEGRPKKPRLKVYSFDKGTAEGVINQMAAYPEQGLLHLVDELAGLFKNANKYHGGRGSDEEDLLSLYDGTGTTVLRADGIRADLPDGLIYGVFGGIQPSVLQRFLKDCQDDNGKWARFLFVNQPLAASEWGDDSGSTDLTPMLADLYAKADRLPSTVYRLSAEAKRYFIRMRNKAEQQRVNHALPGMQATWGKVPGRIGKLAVNLHVIWSLFNGQTPSEEIPLERVRDACKLAKFYTDQVEALYAQFADPDALSPMLAKIIELSKRKGWIKAKEVQLAITPKHRPTPEKVRSWFMELSRMGKGQIRGAARSLEFLAVDPKVDAKVDEVDSLVDESSTAETLANWVSQTKVDKVDDFQRAPTTDDPLPSVDAKVDEVDLKNLSTASTRLPNAQDAQPARNLAVDDQSRPPIYSSQKSTCGFGFDPQPGEVVYSVLDRRHCKIVQRKGNALLLEGDRLWTPINEVRPPRK